MTDGRCGVSHVVATPLTWEVDPFECPRCGREMKMIALIDEGAVIEKILRHLGLWRRAALPVRAPPAIEGYIHEPFFDDLSFEPAVL